MSKVGAVLFFLLMLVVAFGIISFSSEFFLGRPLVEVAGDLMFKLFHQ